MMTPWRLAHAWNDAIRAGLLSYRLKRGKPASQELNKSLIKAALKRRLKTAAVLLDNGASPDAQLSYEHGFTMYLYPLMTELVRRNDIAMSALFIAHAADLSRADTLTGHTPLHEAALHDRARIMRLMLDAGADMSCKTSIHSEENAEYLGHSTALDIARRHAWKDVIEMLENEPQRRDEATEAAARAKREAAEAERKAAEDEARRLEQERIEAITAPKTDTGRDITVSGPIKFKTTKHPKRWGLF